ncbi:phosphoribosylformimino-5-aminoimidazole carboxamide ribotide isomerase, variant 2 [Neurospora crassa OR74A]|uniref:Phosphoribosylformimino-5-aminoimidazole carboxamide ribotide isomerase, variant 2 n=1 Tax=Neurospora crassa (strain ATCC 24698 / 74-OR23-1A / CBS 708.71 / DSM 1257 / FGSC 987) TaxID=367110 RepID=U9W8C9_NEUCR|nr:phosphoribosylformimino-5-aminoimidazole carboxamide ribotide isomerase, variant 2 [Neurospora crassa OR74A]ESA43285.1 phosphoribosylformimino-5-aminoimidazole carboxamide ribotide isomerase, variant 2 [Neurospora crassa OR74A]|eukprot:XP_011393770.1 phosphoribosylformimino-5-aminoimidazole carboxamide ribotide isomerase, variant 2 [Neurospora crassa OR74A]
MTRFRPCIDLHAGQVKQIVGGTLDSATSELRTNFVSPHPPAYFAKLYRDNDLSGAHVIMLGPGNKEAALESLKAWPGGLQVGGGITDANAREWVEAGAEKVIITSYLFPNVYIYVFSFLIYHLRPVLVYDSPIDPIFLTQSHTESIKALEPYCSEFLIHAADNEGLQKGIDEKLVQRLSEWCSIPVTYAGGGRNLEDLETVKRLSGGKVDLTIGSALDCFGGKGVTLQECVEWNRRQ